MYPRLVLNGQQHRILRGHSWAYRNEIIAPNGYPPDGEIADLYDSARRFIARGDFTSKGVIAFRALTRRKEEINENFWLVRLRNAANYRAVVMPGRESFRLVHSEADFLPGLIADRYGSVIVIQTNTLAMDRRKLLLAKLIASLFQAESVLENNTGSSRYMEKLPLSSGPLVGNYSGPVRTKIGRVASLG